MFICPRLILWLQLAIHQTACLKIKHTHYLFRLLFLILNVCRSRKKKSFQISESKKNHPKKVMRAFFDNELKKIRYIKYFFTT